MNLRDAMDRLGEALARLGRAGADTRLPGLPSSAEAALALAWSHASGGLVVCICDGALALEQMHRDLLTLSVAAGLLHETGAPLYFPGRDTAPDPDLAGHRLAVLRRLAAGAPAAGAPRLMATCVQALLQRTVAPAELLRKTLRFEVGREPDTEDLPAALAGAGYEIGPEVAGKGQASVRGGIADVWPPTELWPLRIEFFGPAVESIRTFDPATQKSLERRTVCDVPPADELMAASGRKASAPFLDYLPPDALFLWRRDADVRERAALYEEAAAESGESPAPLSLDELERSLRKRGAAHVRTAAADPASEPPSLPDLQPVGRVFDLPSDVFQPDIMESARVRLLRELRARARAGYGVLVLLDTPGALEHFRGAVGRADAELGPGPDAGGIEIAMGMLSEGFVSDALGMAVVAESDLYGRRKDTGRRYAPQGEDAGPAPRSDPRTSGLADIEPGDLVVHAEHGIGRYLGLYEIRLDDRLQEALSIEYADGAKLHVPVSQASLLSRYVGMPHHKTRLHRLGGRRWRQERQAAEQSIARLAAQMLETQARRDHLPGHPFPPDHPWQHEFEATFPYRETTDQRRVIEAVKHDMETQRPMDRLVCGDAGYGKTEVAMRAAFKAVMDGKQVAVLVPTTVLAQQHFETFSRRMAPFPVRIEMLSRFRSRGQHDRVLRGLADGSVDIVIGTHSLVQPSIRFADLGLLVIDEEQRFGVAHKESLKKTEVMVDILTLTATPIPRTLYMSLTGARDMSLLQTPPRERTAIETIVARNSDAVIREAILRELGREGQIYYLHNRVMTIEMVVQRLRRVIPEARIDFAHGQMPSTQLAAVVRRFAAGEFDVLACTTIIESGTDIPRANTILIDRADRFGMADLYQLRGRVGRSNRKAYAYLLLPAQGSVDAAARKRIGAVETHSGLSAGFSLALRDLEIRGAGNLLGAEQSGHIAAVGFGLYCQMLKQAVARLKGEAAVPIADAQIRLDFVELSPGAGSPDAVAAIPHDYVEDERLRVGAYRRIAECSVPQDVEDLRRELRDRYGPVPPAVERLLKVAAIRALCSRAGVRLLEAREDRVMMTRGGDDYVMPGGRFPRLAARSPDARLDEIVTLVRALRPA